MNVVSAGASYLFVGLFLANVFASDLVIPLALPANAIVVEGSGRFLVGHSGNVTRFHQDGTVDASLGFRGIPRALAVENDGTVLVRENGSIARVNLETGAQPSIISGLFRSSALQPNGQIVANNRNNVVRYNPDGTPDPTFSSSSFLGAFASVLALQDDGRVVIGGENDGSIVRFGSGGTLDATFNAPKIALSWVNAILVQPDGKILLGGQFSSAGEVERYGLLRLNANGNLDSDFNPASELTTSIHSLALQANGKIILSGAFNSINGQPATNIARLNPNGTLDTTFPAVSYDPASSILLALDGEGSVLVGFSNSLVRITNPDPATQSLTREGTTLTWLRGGSSPEIFAARFQASLDGIDWTDLGSGLRIPGGWRLAGATVPPGARLRARGYVAGASYYVDHVPGAPALYSYLSDRTTNFAADVIFHVPAKGLEPLDFQWFKDSQPLAGTGSPSLALTNVTGGDSGIYHLVVSNSEGSSTSRVAQLTVIDPVILRQPTNTWVNAGSTTNLSITAAGTGLSYQWKKDGQDIPDATSPSLDLTNATPEHTGTYQIIVTGAYGTVESDVVTLRVNAALPDLTFNPKYEPTSEALPIQTAVAYNNDLFMGGLFRILDGPARQHLVKFKADGSIDPLFAPEPAGGELAGVVALNITPNGQLLVGGHFLTIAGQSQPHLARLNPDGTLDQQFRPVVADLTGGPVQVATIEVLSDGRMLIGGQFSSVNGQLRPGMARLLPGGELDESFNPDVEHAPGTTWGFIVQPDGKIIAYGWALRRFHPDGMADLDFTEGFTDAATFPDILPLSNGQLLVNSQTLFFYPRITLVDSNGVLDLTLTGLAARGNLGVLEADEQFVTCNIVEGFTNVVGGTNVITIGRNELSRFNLDGTEDPALSPSFDNYALIKAMRADGSILIAGEFTNVAGYFLPNLALIRNTEPATQSLTFNGTNATWLRSATSPAVTRTVFEFSTDGITWTNLGVGERVAGGWQLSGLRLNSSGWLRARGFVRGSIYDATIEISNGIKLGILNHQHQTSRVLLSASAPDAARVILQQSTDLRQWTNLQTNSISSLALQLTLTNQSAPHTFYRLLQTASD